MTKDQALKDAKEYANLIKRCIFVMRRGNQYKASQIEHAGWRVTEIVAPVLLTILMVFCFIHAFMPL